MFMGAAVSSGLFSSKLIIMGAILAAVLGIVVSGINDIRTTAYKAAEADNNIRIANRNAKKVEFVLAASKAIEADKDQARKEVAAVRSELDKARILIPKEGDLCVPGCLSHGLWQL